MGDLLRRRILNSTGEKPNPFQNAPTITATTTNISITPVLNKTNNRYLTKMNNTYHGTSEGNLLGAYTQRNVSTSFVYNIGVDNYMGEFTAPSNAKPVFRWYEANSSGSGTTITVSMSQGSVNRNNIVTGQVDIALIGSTFVLPCTWSGTPYVFCFPKVASSSNMVEYQAVTNTGSTSYYTFRIGNAILDSTNNRVIGFGCSARKSGSGSGGIDIWVVASDGTFTKTHISSWTGDGNVNNVLCDFLTIVNGSYYLYLIYPNIQTTSIAGYWIKASSVTTTSWSAVSNGENLPFDARTTNVKWHQFSDGLIVAYQYSNSIGNGYSACRIYSTWDLIHWDTLDYNVGNYKYSCNIYNSASTTSLMPNWQENSQYYYYLGRNTAGSSPTGSAIIAWPKAS